MMVMMMVMWIAAVVVTDVPIAVGIVAAAVVVVVIVVMMEAFFTYIVGASRHTVPTAVSIAAIAMCPCRIFRLFVLIGKQERELVCDICMDSTSCFYLSKT